MSIKTVTKPPILDETGQDIVAGLTGIANAVQPINIYLDVQMSIPVEGWSATAPHIYNWLYNRITEECGIEVYFMDGAEDVDMKYLEYDKIAGGIRFTIDEIPDAPIPLQVRIINAQTTAVIDPVDSSLVTESAVPGAVNVHEAMENHEERISSNEDSIESIEGKLVEVDNELDLRLKSVNGISGDENGDVIVNETEFTHQIVTDDAQQSTGEFLFRTTGGDASLSDGPAKLVSITGRSVHTGESVETLNMEVNAAERVAPDPITAELDTETFEAYVSGGGVYTIIYTDEWSTDPELYGITITGTPLYGDSISITWDEIADPVMSVFSPRVAPPAITAILNPTIFKAYVAGSGVYTLSYTTEWSEDPALYGVTVSNDPVDGDEIVITYEQSDRGTIVVSNPSKFVSTGWNLYDNSTGKKYAKVKKYSTQYGFLIGGAYASIEFAETIDGARTSISPASGYFAVPADGYVFVTGGDATTYILMTWSDWTEGYEGEFQAYTESVVDLSLIMTQFPYGLMQVGAVADEINFSMMRAISRIERLAYSEANLEYAQSTGRAYEADTNYIYLVKDMEDVYIISETGAYTASDHGIEFVDGDIPVFIETLYGQNLVDKLRTDVLTKSQDLINNLTTNDSTKALSAAQGYVLNGKIVTYWFGDYSSFDSLKSDIATFANTLSQGDERPVGFRVTSTFADIPAGRYVGFIAMNYVTSSARYYNITLHSSDGNDIILSSEAGTWKVFSLNSKISALNTGSNFISEMICAGYNSGSGNYAELFIPINTNGKTITAVTVTSNSAIFLPSELIGFSNPPTITVIGTYKNGVRIEIKYDTTKTANVCISALLTGVTLTCS